MGTKPTVIDPPDDTPENAPSPTLKNLRIPNRPGTSDAPQVAPPAPVAPPSRKPKSRTALPYDTGLGTDAESQEIAAEVAAILSKDQPSTSAETPIRQSAPRPLIVKLPSERWLKQATENLESLPMDERPAAFQAIIVKYRAMRSAERESMHGR